jgi:hypothetical protein
VLRLRCFVGWKSAAPSTKGNRIASRKTEPLYELSGTVLRMKIIIYGKPEYFHSLRERSLFLKDRAEAALVQSYPKATIKEGLL